MKGPLGTITNADVVKKKHIRVRPEASEECPFGFHFLMAMQMVSAADKTTQALPPFSRIMDQVLQQVSFLEVGRCGKGLRETMGLMPKLRF